jgi:hypothetical protein
MTWIFEAEAKNGASSSKTASSAIARDAVPATNLYRPEGIS